MKTVIAKRAKPGWPGDPLGHMRETHFYADLLPRLALPHPHIYYAGPEPDTTCLLVIMEDLADTHRFPPPTHCWTQAEIHSILRTYAKFHIHGQACLPPEGDRDWLMTRHEERILSTAPKLTTMVEEIAAQGLWSSLPGFPDLLSRILGQIALFADHSTTLLHNDVYPPNAGLPFDASGDVVLLDWDMLSWGPAEMDLAYMFLQPFRSHRYLDREAALHYYWKYRQDLTGDRAATAFRRSHQHYADAIWALWLIPVAHRMAFSPYPAGSSVRIYWDSMFEVLGERLQMICREP